MLFLSQVDTVSRYIPGVTTHIYIFLQSVFIQDGIKNFENYSLLLNDKLLKLQTSVIYVKNNILNINLITC